MAANALDAIRQAEAEAKQIRQSAATEAQAILAAAEKDGQKMLDDAKQEALAGRSELLAKADERSKLLKKEAESDAKVKSAVLTQSAEQKMPDAEALILERIATLWQ